MEELKKYTTFDLIRELLTRSNIELEYSLLTLLVERKIDSTFVPKDSIVVFK